MIKDKKNISGIKIEDRTDEDPYWEKYEPVYEDCEEEYSDYE